MPDFYALSRQGAARLRQDMRDVEENPQPTDYYLWESGQHPAEHTYARLTSNNGDGSYGAVEIQFDIPSHTDLTGGIQWENPGSPTNSEVGWLWALSGSASYQTGDIVMAWAWADYDGTVIWLFDSAAPDPITQLCYGSWTIYWDVPPSTVSMGAPTGEIYIADDYSMISINAADDGPTWRSEWLEQFKRGDVMKLAYEASGMGVYFNIDFQHPFLGNFYIFDTSTCDIGNKGAMTSGTTGVQVCLGLNCGGPASIDLDPGPGIQIDESPADNFIVSALLEAGTCITLNDPDPGDAYEISVDLSCVLDYVELNIDWTQIPVCESIEWRGSPSVCLHLVGDEENPGDYKFYGVRTGGGSEKGWQILHDYVLNTTSIQWTLTLTGEEEAEVRLTSDSSITDLAGGLQFVSDEATPGIAHYYGTDVTAPGNKGWYNFTQLTVYTDLQLDGSNNLQYKTTEIWCVEPGIESAWSNVTGWSTTSCE